MRNPGGHQSETDLSGSLSLSSDVHGKHFEITSNFHTRSKLPDARISTDEHQSENDATDSSPPQDNFDSGQLQMRPQKKTNLKIKSESSFVTTELSYATNSNEVEVNVTSSSHSDLKTKNRSQSAHVNSNNHITISPPARHADKYHTFNILQDDSTTSDDLLVSSSLTTTKSSSQDTSSSLLKLKGKSPKLDRSQMCFKRVKPLTDSDVSLSPGAYIFERTIGRAPFSNRSFDNSSISKEVQESDGSFILSTSGARVGIHAELQVPTVGCVKVSVIEANNTILMREAGERN